MNQNSKIYVAGHTGLVGSAIVKLLQERGYWNIVTRSHIELNLMRQDRVEAFFERETPQYVFMAAARVGGVYANSKYPANFIYENLQIQNNIIHASYLFGVKRLVFLGSSCIYPRISPQPIPESALLSAPLESTNEAYAVAKIAGVKMCEAYRTQYGCDFVPVMPCNLYGDNDNFSSINSHVIPALVGKIVRAHLDGEDHAVVWGSGSPLREFMHVSDLADACIFVMNNLDVRGLTNIGTGEEVSIKDLALMIKECAGFKGDLVFDSSKPDGTPRKCVDISKMLQLGWRAKVPLREGVKRLVETRLLYDKTMREERGQLLQKL